MGIETRERTLQAAQKPHLTVILAFGSRAIGRRRDVVAAFVGVAQFLQLFENVLFEMVFKDWHELEQLWLHVFKRNFSNGRLKGLLRCCVGEMNFKVVFTFKFQQSWLASLSKRA